MRTRDALTIAPTATLLLISCGGGGGGGSPPPPQRLHILWTGSVAGEVVLDYDNEHLRFYADTGTLLYRGIEFVNVQVDEAAIVRWNGQVIGGVFYVLSTQNEVITALVSAANTMIDISPIGSQYGWADSGITPVFADMPVALELTISNQFEQRALLGLATSSNGLALDFEERDAERPRNRFELLHAEEAQGDRHERGR